MTEFPARRVGKVAATKEAIRAYVAENPGHKVAIAIDTREQAAEMYRWFHAVPRNGCTASVVYFKDGKLQVYEPNRP